MGNELPDSKEARVDWVIRAPDNAEMRRRYDIWAEQYDNDVGSVADYCAPGKLARVAARQIDPGALIIDAGAGTGLLGAALTEQGFQRLIALDFSEKMLAVAHEKGLYQELHQVDLSQPTALEANTADALVTCGTTTQVPCASLNEYVRLVKSGGKIVFAAVQGTWDEFGYAEVYRGLEESGQLRVTEKGAPFQMMPTTEPQFICEIWVMNVS